MKRPSWMAIAVFVSRLLVLLLLLPLVPLQLPNESVAAYADSRPQAAAELAARAAAERTPPRLESTAGTSAAATASSSDADGLHLKSLRDVACAALERITRRKDAVQQRLRAAAASLLVSSGQGDAAPVVSAMDTIATQYTSTGSIAGPDVDGLLQLFHARLDRSEQLIYLAIGWLEEALQGRSMDSTVMQAVIERRLRALRGATYEEEQEYQRLLHERKEKKHMNHSHHAISIVERVLTEAAEAADDFEDSLKHKLNIQFRALAPAAGHHKPVDAENIRTVLVLNVGGTNSRRSSRSALVRLLDSSGNQFSMTRPRDLTTSGEDSTLLLDLIYLLAVAAAFGFLCSLLRVPHVFGYILAGVVLGPSGADLLTSLVQVETLGEFGAFMIMFSAGLDFSPEKISQVSHVAAPASLCLTAIIVVWGVVVGALINASLAESAFVAICLAMTSTPLVVRFMVGSRPSDHAGTVAPISHDTSHVSAAVAGPRQYGATLTGILVLQDALMGFVIGFLPSLAADDSDSLGSAVRISVILFEFGVFVLAVVVTSVAARRLHVSYARHLSTESSVLLTSGLPFAVLLVMHSLDLSMELGCFLAGVAVNFIDTTLAANLDRLLLPVKNTLSCLFFVTAGLHVFPSFVFVELTSLIVVTLLIILCKFLAAAFVLHTWLPISLRPSKYIMAAGLAQGSEFSFVMSSRARRLLLISREVYLLVTSTSTLTLLLAPIAWHLAAWHVRQRRSGEETS